MHMAEYCGYACASTGIQAYGRMPGAARKRRVRSITVRNISFSDLKGPGRTPGPFLLPRNGNRHRSTRRWGWPLSFHTLNTHVGMNPNACAHHARSIRCAYRRARGSGGGPPLPEATGAHRDGGIGTTSRSEREDSRFETWSLCTHVNAKCWRGRVAKARGCRPRYIAGASPAASSISACRGSSASRAAG